MNLKPLGDRVVIKKVEAEEKTKSGIVLPSSAKEQPQMAKVMAIGADILNDERKKIKSKKEIQLYSPNMLEQKLKSMGKNIQYLN